MRIIPICKFFLEEIEEAERELKEKERKKKEEEKKEEKEDAKAPAEDIPSTSSNCLFDTGYSEACCS